MAKVKATKNRQLKSAKLIKRLRTVCFYGDLSTKEALIEAADLLESLQGTRQIFRTKFNSDRPPLFEMPDAAFSNIVNNVEPTFDFRGWRRSKEWKIFVAGYNHAMKKIASEATAKINMGGLHHEKLYDEKW